MSKPENISDGEFQATVLESDKAVIVDFWAEWCGPCRTIAPHLQAIADEYADQVKVIKIDIDENPMTSASYGVMSIPTLLLFKKGEVVGRITGAYPKDRIIAQFAPHF